MTAVTHRLQPYLRPGDHAPGTDGPSCFYIPIARRPQLSKLMQDMRANQAATLREFQVLLNRCYSPTLYNGPYALHWWRLARTTCANAVISQAIELGFTYNERARQFRQ